jgi:hypothetical protein
VKLPQRPYSLGCRLNGDGRVEIPHGIDSSSSFAADATIGTDVEGKRAGCRTEGDR